MKLRRKLIALFVLSTGFTLSLGMNCLPNIGSDLPQCHRTPDGLVCENF